MKLYKSMSNKQTANRVPTFAKASAREAARLRPLFGLRSSDFLVKIILIAEKISEFCFFRIYFSKKR